MSSEGKRRQKQPPDKGIDKKKFFISPPQPRGEAQKRGTLFIGESRIAHTLHFPSPLLIFCGTRRRPFFCTLSGTRGGRSAKFANVVWSPPSSFHDDLLLALLLPPPQSKGAFLCRLAASATLFLSPPPSSVYTRGFWVSLLLSPGGLLVKKAL